MEGALRIERRDPRHVHRCEGTNLGRPPRRRVVEDRGGRLLRLAEHDLRPARVVQLGDRGLGEAARQWRSGEGRRQVANEEERGARRVLSLRVRRESSGDGGCCSLSLGSAVARRDTRDAMPPLSLSLRSGARRRSRRARVRVVRGGRLARRGRRQKRNPRCSDEGRGERRRRVVGRATRRGDAARRRGDARLASMCSIERAASMRCMRPRFLDGWNPFVQSVARTFSIAAPARRLLSAQWFHSSGSTPGRCFTPAGRRRGRWWRSFGGSPGRRPPV